MDILIESLQVALLALLGLSGIAGLIALVSPDAFAVLALHGNRSILPAGPTMTLDRWVDVDQYVLGHARWFGLVIICSEGFIWSVSHYGPEFYSESFLLITLCVSILLGIFALSHILRQKLEIASNLADARSDALTSLPNRRAFDEEIFRRLAQRKRQGVPLCLQIIDIDNFKACNDGFGHQVGDATLKEVARILVSTARQTDVVVRLGGDEFAVLHPGATLEEASLAAERFRSAIGDNPLCCDGCQHELTISTGVAEAQSDDDAKSLVRRADEALYAAKDAGKNSVTVACHPRKPGGRS